MQHNAAFPQGMQCFSGYAMFAEIKHPSGTEIHHNLETSTCDQFKYNMGRLILIVSICMEKPIRIQRVK